MFATGFGQTSLIHNAERGKQSSRQVMEGLIATTNLTEFQHKAIDGLIHSAHELPRSESIMSEHSVRKVKAPATEHHYGGGLRYPGSHFK